MVVSFADTDSFEWDTQFPMDDMLLIGEVIVRGMARTIENVGEPSTTLSDLDMDEGGIEDALLEPGVKKVPMYEPSMTPLFYQAEEFMNDVDLGLNNPFVAGTSMTGNGTFEEDTQFPMDDIT
jgi:hypothetical protein